MLRFSAALLLLLASPIQASEAVTQSHAAELVLHRIERLVILRRIDKTFQTNFSRLLVEPRIPQAPTDPAFVVRSFQVAGEDGTSKSVEISLDAEGRALAHELGAGADSVSPPTWPSGCVVQTT